MGRKQTIKSSLPVPREHDEQVAFVAWLEANKLKFYAVPNSQGVDRKSRKSLLMMARARKEGHRKGVPDLVVFIPEVGTLYIEMKRVKGSVVRKEQTEWIEFLNTMPRTQAFIAKGAAQAIQIVQRFLNLTQIKTH